MSRATHAHEPTAGNALRVSRAWPRLVHRLPDAALTLLLWTAGAVALAAGFTTGSRDYFPVPFTERLEHFLPFYWIWAALTPAVRWVSKRVSGSPWTVVLAAHAVAGVAVASLQILLYVPVSLSVGHQWGTAPFSAHVSGTLERHLPGNLLTYACVAMLTTVADYRRRMREQVDRARLEALQAQLQPHFLLNALQVASSLVREDPTATEEMLERLGDFLRVVLRSDHRRLVPLSQELELVEDYVAIMRLRFGERLGVETVVDVSSTDLGVPLLLLQPLVENAVRHGVAQRARGGKVRIVVRQEATRLLLRVEDDGPGLAGDAPNETERVGLSNTRARLQHLFPGDHAIRLSASEDGGLRVEIELPAVRSSERRA